MQDRQQCPLCLKTGLIQFLQSYQINLEEAVVLCENKKCPYPLAQSSVVSATYTRSYESISSNKSHEEASSVPASQLALQTKVASHMRKMGQRLQKDAVGIQTGSPQLKKKSKSHFLKNKESLCKRAATLPLQRQSGSNHFSHLLETGSQSVQNDLTGSSWSNCNGSEGGSDKDSSFDSLESNSLASSNSSLSDSGVFTDRTKYPSFKFGQKKSRSSVKLVSNSQELSSRSGKRGTVLDTTDNGSLKTNRLSSNSELVSSGELHKSEIENNFLIKQCPVATKESMLDFTKRSKNHESYLNTCHQNNVVKLRTGLVNPDLMLKYPPVFPQWRNKDALCWLDVILCLAAHNVTLKTHVFEDGFDKNSLIYKLLRAHNQACQLLQKSQMNCEKNGCGRKTELSESPQSDIGKNSNQVHFNGRSSKQNQVAPSNRKNGLHDDDTAQVEDMLDKVREEVWEVLKCRLKCEKGQNESPVFAFPLLFKETEAVNEMFRMKYSFQYKCTKCGLEEVTDHSNTLPTFPTVIDNFSISDPKHQKTCPRCSSTTDPRTMTYRKLPECLLMHFTNGLPEVSWSKLQFGFHGNMYTVTGVVQYLNNPDHFIAWLRNPNAKKWIKCDDLRSTLCKYRTSEPNFLPSQIHIIMWERVQTKARICRQVAMDTEEDVPMEDQLLQWKYRNKSSIDYKPLYLNSDKCEKLKKPSNCTEHRKKSMSLVSDINLVDSPCSTLSTESSDSVLLPNFVSMTPVSTGVLRPIPKPVCSVSETCTNPGSTIQAEVESQDVCLNHSAKFKESGEKSDNIQRNADVLRYLKLKIDGKVTKTADQNEKTDVPQTQICGQRTLIEPSTVFCIPKKGNVEIASEVRTTKTSEEQERKDTNLNDSEQNTHLGRLEKYSTHSVIDQSNDLDSKNLNVSFDSFKMKVEKTHVVINAVKDINIENNHVGMIDKNDKNPETKSASSNNDADTDSKLKRQTRYLRQSSRFKIPIGVNRKPSLSKDAFFTLESKNSSRDSSAGSTPVSISTASSPGLQGNVTLMNSVKQYLLSRTTGRSEQKFKFEGLNLKSRSSRGSSVGLLELDLPVSSNNADFPDANKMGLDYIDTESINSGFSSSQANTGALVSDLIEKLEQSPAAGMLNPLTLKRKLENISQRSPKRRIQDNSSDSDNTSSGNVSLKENSGVRRKVPGGKSMKLVRKLVKKAEKAKPDENYGSKEHVEIENDEVKSMVFDGNNTKNDIDQAKCDSDTVLQDLYEALNIPFNSVNSTMSEIITDVDDLLKFVNVADDVLPDLQPHGDRPSSCFGGTIYGSQKHHDCWIRRPGRNSA